MNHFTLLKNRNLNKWIGFLIAFLIFGATIWYSNQFVQELRKEEQTKIENYAKAVQLFGSDEQFSSGVQDYLLNITSGNQTMPVIVLDEQGEIILVNNISEEVQENPLKMNRLVIRMKELHEPIEVDLGELGKQYVYYEN